MKTDPDHGGERRGMFVVRGFRCEPQVIRKQPRHPRRKITLVLARWTPWSFCWPVSEHPELQHIGFEFQRTDEIWDQVRIKVILEKG